MANFLNSLLSKLVTSFGPGKKEMEAKQFIEEQQAKNGTVTSADLRNAMPLSIPSIGTFGPSRILSEGAKEFVMKPFARAVATVGSTLLNKSIEPETPFGKSVSKEIFGSGNAGEGEKVLPLTEAAKRLAKDEGFLGQAVRFAKEKTGIDEKYTATPLLGLFTIADLFPGNPNKASKVLQKAENISRFAKYGEEVLSSVQKLAKGENVSSVAPVVLKEIEQIVSNAPEIAKEVEQASKLATPALEKERKFITSIKNSEGAAAEVKNKISGLYNVLGNKETIEEAAYIVNSGEDEALKFLRDTPQATAKSNAVAMILADQFQKAGKFEQAIDLLEQTAAKATSQGQAIQALSLWSKLTPVGALRYTQKVMDKAKAGKLDEGIAKDIAGLAEDLSKIPDGTKEKARATAKLLDKIAEQIPASIGQKVSTIQTIAQLLNPKTSIRNLLGNTSLAFLENVKDVVGTAVEKVALTPFTKKRFKTLPSFFEQAKGFSEGFKAGLADALEGIDTSASASKFDLPVGATFRKGPLALAEQALNITLKAPDRAFYQAAYERSINQLKRANNISEGMEVPEDLKEMAHLDALYSTAQNDSVVSNFFSGFKKLLNGGKKWGIGDIVIKYPKTPGNLISTALDYSPAGFIKAAFQIVSPLVGGKLTKETFNQKKFVDAFSRALVGSTGLVGTGALLHKLGIIQAEEPKRDVSATLESTGLSKYQINVTALKRLVMSGFKPEEAQRKDGDILVNYDWLQPAAIPFAMGVDIDANNGKSKDKTFSGSLFKLVTDGEALKSASDAALSTVTEQPLFKGIQTLFNTQGSSTDKIFATLATVPSSFVPSLLNQIRQIMDNTARQTYDPNPLISALNKVRSRIPGLSDDLIPAYDVFGNKKEIYQGDSNTFLNVFFNPAFVKRYIETPEAKLVLDVYEKQGDTSAVPNEARDTFTFQKEEIKLNRKELANMQQDMGVRTRNVLQLLASSAEFGNLNDSDKAKTLAKAFTNIGQKAKLKAYAEHYGVDTSRVSDEQLKAFGKALDESEKFSSLNSSKKKEIIEKFFSQFTE